MKPLKRWGSKITKKYPDLPFWLSVIALIASILMPLLRKFLEEMI